MNGIESAYSAIESAASQRGGPHEEVVRYGRALKDGDGNDRRDRADAALILYHGSGRYSFTSSVDSAFEAVPPGFNLIQSAVDTLVSNVVRNKIRPMIVTENGDAELKEKAVGMQRAVEGLFQNAGLYGDLAFQVARTGFLFDAGLVKIWPDYQNRRVAFEPVFAHEIFVSPIAARRGRPRDMWQCAPVPREKLMAEYGDEDDTKKVIENAPTMGRQDLGDASAREDQIADVVEVWEYWHLPSGRVDLDDDAFDLEKCKHDGVHFVCTENGTLLREAWPFDYFPFAKFRPYKTAVGYFSTGVPERIAGAQIELNKLNDRIDRIIHLHAVPRLLVWEQAKINQSKVTNDIASVLTTKVPPTQAAYYLAPPSIPSELLRRIDDVTRWAERQLGLPEMALTGSKPAGVDHAPGMQHLSDEYSVRQTTVFREWENFYLEAATISIDCLRLLSENCDGDFEVVFGDSKQLRRIRWDEVDLDADKFHLKIWPTNLLPQTPGAKKSYVVDLMNAGLFSQQQGMMALDFPDIEAIMGDQTAAAENVERVIVQTKKGEMVVPEPFMDLEQLKTKAASAINRMQVDGDDEAAIDRVRKLYLATVDLQNKMMPPPPEAIAPPAPEDPGLTEGGPPIAA